MTPKVYRPNFLLRNGHFNTIYPTLFRKQDQPNYTRKKISTWDDDFLHIDMLAAGHNRIAILCHGLEGSSSSQYIISTGKLLNTHGWDIAALNYRGCSGVINDKLHMYHSGSTSDLQVVIDSVIDDYDELILIGFSLGGNICLKYTGENASAIDVKISRTIAVSVPVDLKAGSVNIGKRSNKIYERNFLKTLTQKAIEKHKQYPDAIDLSYLKGMKKLYDFDDRYTGPIHGFLNAEDYYAKCSSKQFLHDIKIPSLIVNALDDPFLPEECYPYKEIESNKHLQMLTPKYGGHVGFVQPRQEYYWIEETILHWLKESE